MAVNMDKPAAPTGQGPAVIGYSPNGGFLIRGTFRANSGDWFEPFLPGDQLRFMMANPVDRKVLGACADDAVAIVWRRCDTVVRRYLCRGLFFCSVPAEAADDDQLVDRFVREQMAQHDKAVGRG